MILRHQRLFFNLYISNHFYERIELLNGKIRYLYFQIKLKLQISLLCLQYFCLFIFFLNLLKVLIFREKIVTFFNEK